MLRILHFIALLLFYLTTYGIKENNIYPNYYVELIDAESLLIGGDYKESLSAYTQTLSNHHSNFMYDFLVPLQLAIYLNDTVSFVQLLEILEPDREGKDNLLRFLQKKVKKWNKSWELELSNLNLRDSEVSVYKHFIDSVFICDQKDRELTYGMSLLNRRSAMKAWDTNTLERITKFFELVERDGFPNDVQMGLHPSYLYHKKMMVLFYHYPKTFSQFKSNLKEWLFAGDLHLMHYVWIEEFEYRHRKHGILNRNALHKYGFFISEKKLKSLSVKQSSYLNENREEIGLASVEHQLVLKEKLDALQIFRYAFL